MCHGYGCGCHPWYHPPYWHYHPLSVGPEEEREELEAYKRNLERQLEGINKRLKELKK